jgi:putative transposase
MEELRHQHPVPPLCRLLGVSASGYYVWRRRKPSLRTQQEPRMGAEIQAAHRQTQETCGPQRLQKDLAEHGVQVGLHRIRRLRKKLGLRCKQKRKFKATTDSTHNLPVAPNLLEHRFTAEAPDRLWTGDLT